MLPIYRLTALGFLGCILLTACSDNEGMRYRYEAEKMLFQANKAVTKAEIKPELNPPGTTDSLRNRFAETSVFCFDALDKVDAARFPKEHNELAHLAYLDSLNYATFSEAGFADVGLTGWMASEIVISNW